MKPAYSNITKNNDIYNAVILSKDDNDKPALIINLLLLGLGVFILYKITK